MYIDNIARIIILFFCKFELVSGVLVCNYTMVNYFF